MSVMLRDLACWASSRAVGFMGLRDKPSPEGLKAVPEPHDLKERENKFYWMMIFACM
jgi:hypothetical protein